MRGPSIFHEPWWLDAAAGNSWQDVLAEMTSGQCARLTVFRTRKAGIPMLGMPPLTRALGPCVEGLDGKNETARRMKMYLLNEIIEKLPKHTIFNQVFEPGDIDGLAFRLNGFTINTEYTFRFAGGEDAQRIWSQMRDTMRRAIRRAEEKLSVQPLDVSEFVDFYFRNLAQRGRRPQFTPEQCRRILLAAKANDAVEIHSAAGADGQLWAAVATVYDNQTMYYLLTTQSEAAKDGGSVALLIWRAIKSAAEKGLIFDFDGFGDSGSAVFLSQFGGTLCPRLRVSKMPKMLQSVLHLGPRFKFATREQ